MVKKFMQNWGPCITAIPIICTEGIIDIGMYAGNVNAVTFLKLVTDKLCPNLLPFNGRNPRSVVILGREVCEVSRSMNYQISFSNANKTCILIDFISKRTLI